MSNTKLQIKDIIMNFSNENLNAEFSNKALEILDKMEEANEQILETSRTDIWAASILNIVLDMNGVFNKKHPMYMTKKDFSSKINQRPQSVRASSSISKTTIAAIASTTGTARGITQGSWRPCASRVTSFPSRVTVS